MTNSTDEVARLEYFDLVRAQVADFLFGVYDISPREGAHELHLPEGGLQRVFWSDFRFEEVVTVGPEESELLQITFHDASADKKFRFDVDLNLALDRWLELTGRAIARELVRPFSTEIIWYMVCFIGVYEKVGISITEGDLEILNPGGEIFGPLPDNPNMETFYEMQE